MKKASFKIGVLLVAVILLGTYSTALAATTIRFNVNHGIEDEPLFEEVAANFEKANPDVKVEFQNTASGDDYYQKLTVMAAGGTLPDVFYMRGGSGDMRYYKKNVAYNLDELVERDKDEINFSDFLESQLPELKYDGHYRALPYDYSTLGIYYNKSLFDEAGVAYPSDDMTWEDVLELALKLSKDDAKGRRIQWGLAIVPNSGNHHWYEGFIMTEGGSIFNDDYTKCVIDSPESMAVVKMWAEFVTKYKVTPAPGEVGQENPYFTGRAAMTIDGSWATMVHRRLSGFPFDVAMLPKGKDGGRVISATGGSWAIAINEKNIEEAWAFVKYLTDVEATRILIVEPIRSLPSRKSLIPEWTEKIAGGGLDPKNAGIFGTQVVEYGRNSPTVTYDYLFVLNNKLPLANTGERPVEEIVKGIADEINKLIAEEK